MKIIRKKDVKITRSSNEIRSYYLPNNVPFEIIETIMKSGDEQEKHRHVVIQEASLVVYGEVVVLEEREKGGVDLKKIKKGDFVYMKPYAFHSLKNDSSNDAIVLTFKFLGKEKENDLFKNDKTSKKGKL